MMDETTLEKIMEQYSEYLLRLAYYYTRDLATSKDLVQDIFIKLYYANYQEQGEIKAYLSRLTANRCKDYLRSWSYRKIILQKKLAIHSTTVEADSLVKSEELSMLDAAILALPVKQREAIMYYYLENLTTKEIATILQIAESTLKSRLQAARARLKIILAEEEWEELLHD